MRWVSLLAGSRSLVITPTTYCTATVEGLCRLLPTIGQSWAFLVMYFHIQSMQLAWSTPCVYYIIIINNIFSDYCYCFERSFNCPSCMLELHWYAVKHLNIIWTTIFKESGYQNYHKIHGLIYSSDLIWLCEIRSVKWRDEGNVNSTCMIVFCVSFYVLKGKAQENDLPVRFLQAQWRKTAHANINAIIA